MPYAVIVACSPVAVGEGVIGACSFAEYVHTAIGTAATASRNGVARRSSRHHLSSQLYKDLPWSLVARPTAEPHISYEFGSTFHIVDKPNPNPRRAVRS